MGTIGSSATDSEFIPNQPASVASQMNDSPATTRTIPKWKSSASHQGGLIRSSLWPGTIARAAIRTPQGRSKTDTGQGRP